MFEMQWERQPHRIWGWKRRKDLEGDRGENNRLIDGICAWMRGWRDVEEGFRIRAQARNQRRETMRCRTSDTISSQGNTDRRGEG